jgi:hypothetical protein
MTVEMLERPRNSREVQQLDIIPEPSEEIWPDEADFSLFLHEGYKDIKEEDQDIIVGLDSPLFKLMDQAYWGEGDREVMRNRAPRNQEWTTVTRSFFLRQRIF